MSLQLGRIKNLKRSEVIIWGRDDPHCQTLQKFLKSIKKKI